MKIKSSLSLLLLFVLSLFVSAVKAQTKTFNHQVYDSVALLYTQTVSGDMKMTCTVTTFSSKPEAAPSTKTVYRFVSAAHCVEGNDDKAQKLQKFYISADNAGQKDYLAAKLVEAGDKHQGDDFSLFEVTTTDKFTVTPLGDDSSIDIGSPVVNVAGPLGLGKQFYQGFVSELHLDRPPVDAGQVLWTDLMLVQIGGGPGSSGSAIVSVDQKAIIGFLVGSAPSDIGKLCVPVAKFKAFIKAVDAGTYKKTKKDEDASPASQDQ
jgi:S1-C subfamily serine protease